MNAAEQYVLPPEGQGLAVYNEFRAQLAKLAAQNAATVFDYQSDSGEKEARSYVYRLRQTKKPIDDARKTAKASALEYGRRVDAEANEIVATIDGMIEQHMAPLREKEQLEAERVAAHRAVIDFILSLVPDHDDSADDIADLCGRLSAVVVDDNLEEFRDEAATAYVERSNVLQSAHAAAVKREAEEAELTALRAEKVRRDQQDREAEIARVAAENAKREAEEAAERGRLALEAAQRREQDAAAQREKATAERAERAEAEAKAAELRATQAAQEAEARLRREAEAAESAARAEQARREADTKHKAAINRAAVAALMEHAHLPELSAKAVMTAIAKGQIPAVTVAY